MEACIQGDCGLAEKLISQVPEAGKRIKNAGGNTLLHLATSHGNETIVKLLLRHDYNDKTRNNDGFTALHLACQNGHDNIVNLLLNVSSPKLYGVVNIQSTTGLSPLHFACRGNRKSIVQSLLDIKSCDIGAKDGEGNTPMHLACYRKHVEIVRLFLTCKRYVANIANKAGITPEALMIMEEILKPALQSDNSQMFKQLLSDSDADLRVNQGGETLLHLAAKYDALSISELLLEECNPNLQDTSGITPLHIATLKKNTELCRLFTANSKCNPSIQDSDGNSPMHCACHQRHIEIIGFFINCKNYIPNIANHEGVTPETLMASFVSDLLDIAFLLDDPHIMTHLMIEVGVNPSLPNEVGDTLLHTTARGNSVAVSELLLYNEKCNPNHLNKAGQAPLHVACLEGSTGICRTLAADYRSDVNLQDMDGNTALHIAARLGNVEACKIIAADESCSLNVQNVVGLTPLHLATVNGNLSACECLAMDRRLDASIQDSNGNTAFHVACYNMISNIIQLFLKLRQYPNLANKEGKTPEMIPLDDSGNYLLHSACVWGEVEAVDYLVSEVHADVNSQNKNGEIPLHISVSQNNTAITAVLLREEKCNPNIQDSIRGNTPLHSAVLVANVELCKALTFNSKCNLNMPNMAGNTALHLACTQDSLAICEILTGDHRCDINLQDKDGNTPLHIVISCSNMDGCLFKLLATDSNSNPNIQNKLLGDTPLHIAARNGNVEACRAIAALQKSDLNIPNTSGNAPLHVACLNDAFPICEILTENEHCDINQRDSNDSSALHIATAKENIDLCELITTKSNCNPNITDTDGNSPLHIAVSRGNMDICKTITANQKCNLNIRNTSGDTPFHLAIEKSNLALWEFLASDNRCDINLQDRDGNTIFHIACYRKLPSMIQLFLKRRQYPKLMNNDGETPEMIPLDDSDDLLLHKACVWGEVESVKFLVCEAHIDVNCLNAHGETPLHTAVAEKNCAIAEVLLNDDICSPNVADNVRGETPLHAAVLSANIKLCRLLTADTKCNPNIQNQFGLSPLHLACKQENLPICNILIADNRCNINLQDTNGNTALHIIVSLRNLDACKAMVPILKCDLNIQNFSGNAPIHLASMMGDLLICKCLTTSKSCDINLQDDNGSTALHIAASKGNSELCKLITAQSKCDPNIADINGNAPLHIAVTVGSIDVCKVITANERCNPNIQNVSQATPLHLACVNGNLSLCECLAPDKRCEVGVQDMEGNTAFHLACYHKLTSIIQLFLKLRQYPNVRNKEGESPEKIPLNESGDLLLHSVCVWGEVETVKYLVSKAHININCRNKHGESPLHTAVSEKSYAITEALLKEGCNPNAADSVKGDTPLHAAVISANIELCTLFARNANCNPNILNLSGNSPLHLAVLQGNLNISQILTADEHCDINMQDSEGNTALHIAVKESKVSIANFLLLQEQCDPNKPNLAGNTPLHIACICGETSSNILQVARELLSSSIADPECVNNAGQTPVELTTNYQLIQDISHFTKCKTKHSVETYIKVFIIGNPSTGKSTLVAAICKEAGKWWKLLPSSWRRVKNVPSHTAGIIPITFRSKKFGNTVLYDMAGQHEYYSSHAAVIENSVVASPAAFVIVVNLAESIDDIISRMGYWISFIGSHSAKASAPSHVILVASHEDVVKAKGGNVQQKMGQVSAAIREMSPILHISGEIALDCRKVVSKGLDRLCFLLDQSCSVLRKAADIDLRCHVLYAFLQEKFKGEVACTLSDIALRIKEADVLLPQNPEGLLQLIASLHDKGLLLLVKGSSESEDTWAILQKPALLCEVNGAIFAPEEFTQHKHLCDGSTGVVPLSRLKRHFIKYDSRMIIGFLTHLEFCIKVDDTETLQTIQDESLRQTGVSLDPSEEYYFFPALVNIDNPLHVWQPNPSIHYQCGWYYKCSKPSDFLNARFLHVLILRLAFAFALAQESTQSSPQVPVLCRRCSVWKHGIGWLNRDGIETVVEVGLQCQWVTAMMRCAKDVEVKCAQLRSAIIGKILETRREFCPTVTMTEAFVHPDKLEYPFTGRKDLILYDLTEIASVTSEKKTHALDISGKTYVDTSQLLSFEPYLSLGRHVLDKVFSKKNSEKPLTDGFLSDIAGQIHREKLSFEMAIEPHPARYSELCERAPNDSVRQCIYLLQVLRDRTRNQTIGELRTELNRFSIFCGRNPLEIAGKTLTVS